MATALSKEPAWASNPAVLEALFRMDARACDWKGCEAALMLMGRVHVDPHRADLLFQVLRIAAASGTLVLPAAAPEVIQLEQQMVERKAAARSEATR